MNSKNTLKLSPSWKKHLAGEFEQPYMQELSHFLASEAQAGKEIFPPRPLIFNAFNSTPFDKVKVVILGQDPYHGPGQAHGLSFSVTKGIDTPPSLNNILKELNTDLGVVAPNHGCLTEWARQGVLLLNTSLTVEKGMAGSHSKKGWSAFTDAAIKAVSEHGDKVVFMLWGAHAQSKAALIDSKKHLVLNAPHPSPLSVYRGFYGCKHFSACNEFLRANGRQPVEWDIAKLELSNDGETELSL
jgi:uracil-DNA glycosylase